MLRRFPLPLWLNDVLTIGAVIVYSRTHKAENGVHEEYMCHVCQRILSSSAKLASHLFSHATAGRAAVPGASVSLADLPVPTTLSTNTDNGITVDPTVATDGEDMKSSTQLDNVSSVPLMITTSLVAEAEAVFDDIGGEDVMSSSIRHALVCPEVGCTKAFWSRVGLAQHLRVHAGEQPFRCGECSATFTSRSSLNQHSITHIHGNGNDYRCDWCGSCFNRRCNWERHCALATCAPAALDSLLAVPLEVSSPVANSISNAAVTGVMGETSMGSNSSASVASMTQQGNWSPASDVDDTYTAYSPEYDFVAVNDATIINTNAATASSASPYSVISGDSADVTPSWCSPESMYSIGSDGSPSSSPAYSECDSEYSEEIASLLAVLPSATSLIGDALYDPSAPSSSLWLDMELPPQ